jgi:Na+-driven multidrug efflux pump
LAGLGVASAALITGTNVLVFLAYGTTPIVARQVGRRFAQYGNTWGLR